jgi:hypothetical protein
MNRPLPSTFYCLFIICSSVLSTSCTYLKHASIQADYTRLQQTDPSQRNLKHMISRPNFAVMGKTLDHQNRYRSDTNTKAVAAFSNRYQLYELVDVMSDISVDTHFGLDLPEGNYDIVVFSDLNQNGYYESSEAIGQKKIAIDAVQYPAMVVTQLEIALGEAKTLDWKGSIAVEKMNVSQNSFFFPAGTIRTLDDPVFSPEISTLGLYDPAAFFDHAPTLFMALEEDFAFKIPVIFVHGIGGSAREFVTIIEQLDRSRFKPWFFHYPSGGDLNQMAQLFYDIFLSNSKILVNEANPMVIVAHSMGGLVVRESLNLIDDKAPTNITFISLASPFGGHPSARNVDKSNGLILPSWRDLNPNGKFIKKLYRKPLPQNIEHLLFYAYNNNSTVKLGDNSDGVVPLSSQLHTKAQQQSMRQLGLNVTHTEILSDTAAIVAIIDEIEQLKSNLPEAHFIYARQGGFNVNDHNLYSAEEAFYLNVYGCYMRALSEGFVTPYNSEQAIFTAMLNGDIPPKNKGIFASDNKAATAWLKYRAQREPNFGSCEE